MEEEAIINKDNLRCGKCDLLLVAGKVNVTYLNSSFPTQLLRCPKCGQSFISEKLALGKAVEVEKVLEDK